MGAKNSNHHIEIGTTSKGFRVANIKIDNYPLSTSSIWVDAGSSKDPLNKLGLAHLFEHLLATKTKKYPDRQMRLQEIEKNGFLFNAFTSLQSQHYYYVHAPNKSRIALDYLIDGLVNSLFTEEDIENEKKTVLAEEKENRNDPASYIWRVANRGMWGEDGLGKDFYGTEKTIASISNVDFNSFFEKYFIPSNILFVFINSSLEPGVQERIIDSNWNLPQFEKNGPDPLKKALSINEHITYEKMRIDNSQLALSFITTPANTLREKTTQSVLVNYLASGWTSRFIQRLRIQENLTYWVNSDTAHLKNSGYIRFSLSTDNQNVSRILEIFAEEVNLLRNAKITGENLSICKLKLTSDLFRNAVSYEWLMQWYGFTTLLNSRQDSVDEYCADIESIQPDELELCAREYLSNERFSIAYLAQENEEFQLPIFL